MRKPAPEREATSKRQPKFMGLAFAQYAVVCACLVAVVTVGLLSSGLEPGLLDFYIERVAIKDFEVAYGFETGSVAVSGPDGSRVEIWGITSVATAGEFARLGVQTGDIPFEHHGHGAQAMHQALRAAASGRPGSFDVVNARSYFRDRALRGIRVPPR